MPSAEDAKKHLLAEHQFGEIAILGDDGEELEGKNYLVLNKTEAEWLAGQHDQQPDGRQRKWKQLMYGCDKCTIFWTKQEKKVTTLVE